MDDRLVTMQVKQDGGCKTVAILSNVSWLPLDMGYSRTGEVPKLGPGLLQRSGLLRTD